jgi:hypothetical protein
MIERPVLARASLRSWDRIVYQPTLPEEANINTLHRSADQSTGGPTEKDWYHENMAEMVLRHAEWRGP